MIKRVLLILTLLSFSSNAEDIVNLSLKQARLGNFEQAKELLIASANDGNSEAQYLLSIYYRDPDALNNPEIGKQWLIKAANNNNPDAQYAYAWSLASGWITAPVERLSEIVYWFEKAGYNGSDKAYANLATLYDNDEREVLKEVEELANKGDAMAQYNIGWINGRGLLTKGGLKQDEDVAESWFKKSAKQGFQDAIDVLKRNF